MAQERVSGFIMAQDVVRGKEVWKVRVNKPGDPMHQKKCRIVNVHGDYEPKRGDDVTFVLGSTVDSGHAIYQAYDVCPAVQGPGTRRELPVTREEESDVMNWFIVRANGGHLYAATFGFDSLQEAQEELGKEGEEVIAFVPFDIREHADEWDDPDIVDAFRIVAALQSTTSTCQALEKLVTVIMNAAIKQLRS